jgi:hypothetical protein
MQASQLYHYPSEKKATIDLYVVVNAILFAPETIPASSDNCLLSGDAGRGCDWYKIVRMTPDKTTRDACGKRYAFTSHKDRCPVCCPVQKKDEDSPGEYDQTDFSDPTEARAGNCLRSGYAGRGCCPVYMAVFLFWRLLIRNFPIPSLWK